MSGISCRPMKWKLENRLSVSSGPCSPSDSISLSCSTAHSPSTKASSWTMVPRVRKNFTASSMASPRVLLLIAA